MTTQAPRPCWRRALLLSLLLILMIAFAALGSWQLQRRVWKLERIARVERYLQSPPVAAPARADWAGLGADAEYRKVRVEGRFMADREVFVQAVTERGPGYWLMIPLLTASGDVILVNRGFVETRRPYAAGDAPQSLSGLLRLSEPGGGFLRHNDAAAQRWFSRDVAAIGAALKLPAPDVAPYFIDADASADQAGTPLGGLTVVRFHNSHLVYAITWFTLALMAAAAAVMILRRGHRLSAPEAGG